MQSTRYHGHNAHYDNSKAEFIHTIPDKSLAPAITAPADIKGEHKAITITDWNDYAGVLDALSALVK